MLWRICGKRKDSGKRTLVLPSKLTSLVPLRPPGGRRNRDSHDLPLQAPPTHFSPENTHPPTRPSFESYMTERSTAPLRGGLVSAPSNAMGNRIMLNMVPVSQFPSRPQTSRDGGRNMSATDQPSPRRANAVYNDPNQRV
jgi:hypothetical protein